LVRSDDIACRGCTATIERTLSALPGIQSVKGDVESKVVTIEHDDSVALDAILEKMDEAGFTGVPVR
jgi:copper chaperone CopZ